MIPPAGIPAAGGVRYDPSSVASVGEIVQVVFDVADDAYIDVERHLAAAIARD